MVWTDKRSNAITREYGEKAYKFSDNMITVVIPFNRPVNEPVKLTKSTKKVLNIIKANADITINDLISETGVARETINWALKFLRENGYIKRVGSDKAGHWEIIDEQ